jgi:acyl-CoA synthetase (AMP-forming)/AMP-acid ligase II
MLLHRHFVRVAKKYGNKLAFVDRTSDRRITYSQALIASLILAEKMRKYGDGFTGIMIPTSAGCALFNKDIILANLPYFHVFGLTVNLWTPLYFGMTIIAYANPLDYKKICSILREEKPTVMAGTPGFFGGTSESLIPAISGACVYWSAGLIDVLMC